ncbi:hypothetical protein [Brucella sp. IR073]|uniref:hypothetical protein n=1 Tax=unclassified Brucella TaxID=2632610 RepID=UPI003B986BA7
MKLRIDAVAKEARKTGLIGDKSARIAGRVSPILVEQAKRLTGIQSDTDLIEFALANVAIEYNFLEEEDKFPEEFEKLKGTVDPTLDLEF